MAFIFNSWLKSFHAAPAAKAILPAIYFDAQHKLIEALLKRCTVLVACSSADSTQLMGYVVVEHMQEVPVLHYAYVKHAFRGLGIAKMLMQNAAVTGNGFYTHRTDAAIKLFDKRQSGLVYNPYLAYGVL